MSYELSVQSLTRNTKEKLVDMITEELEAYRDAEETYGEGEGINHIGNIERICYTLRNCDYEGREA